MKRKITVLTLCAVLFALCGSVNAQQPKKVFRIDYLSATDRASDAPLASAIRLALRELGYIEGDNINIEYRHAEGKPERQAEHAAELVRLKVDLILVAGGDGGIRVATNATKSIPIILTGFGSESCQGRVHSKPCPAGWQPHRRYRLYQGTRREAAGATQGSRSQTCPCRGAL